MTTPAIGDVVTTLEEFQALPYGTVLVAGDGTSTDGHDLLQVDGMGYTDDPWVFAGRYTGYVLWDRSDRWLAFDEAGPSTVIHIPPRDEPAEDGRRKTVPHTPCRIKLSTIPDERRNDEHQPVPGSPGHSHSLRPAPVPALRPGPGRALHAGRGPPPGTRPSTPLA